MVKVVDENVRPLSPPSFMGYSSLSTPDLSAAKAVEGLGNLLGQAVGIADFFQQKDITDTVNKEANALTEQIASQLGEADVFGKQLKQGVITQEQYWLKMNNLAKTLRSKYPGQEAAIDRALNAKLGITPANALRSLYFKKLESEKTKTNFAHKTNIRLLQQIVGTGYPIEEEIVNKIVNETDPEQTKKNQEFLFGLLSKASNIKYKKQQLDLLDKERKLTNETKLDTAKSVLADHTTSFIRRKFYLAEKNIRQMQEQFLEDGVLTPEETKQLQQAAFMLEQQYRKELMDLVFSADDPTQKSIASTIGSEEANKLVEDQVGMFSKMFLEPLVGGDFKLLDINKNIIEAAEQNDKMLWMRDPLLRTITSIRQNLGQEGAKYFIERNFNKFQDKTNWLQYIYQSSRSMGLSPLDNNRPVPLVKTASDAAENATPSEKRKVALAVFESVKEAFLNPKTPDDIKINVFQSMFGKGNEGFLANVEPEDRRKIFSFMISEGISAQVKELAKKDPDVINQYNRWVQSNFAVLSKSTFDTLNDLESMKGVKIVPDEEGFLSVEWAEQTNKRGGGARTQQFMEAKEIIDEYNTALSNYYKSLKAVGNKKPEEFIKNLYQLYGIGIPDKGGVEKEGDKTSMKTGNYPVAAKDLEPEAAAFLAAIAKGEAPGYDVIYGGGRVKDLSWHPGIYKTIRSGPNRGKKTSAAGRYQFLERTWNEYAKKVGVKDFSPESQDKVAWALASDVYKRRTGKDLLTVLKSRDKREIAKAAQILSSIWTSLPRGIESTASTQEFLERFFSNLPE